MELSIKDLTTISQYYQDISESYISNNPSGSCYLSGYCLVEFIKGKGLAANLKHGCLGLRTKSGKWVSYGKIPYKSKMVGEYHTWCELVLNGEIVIIDPSSKYNRRFLKETMKIKLNSGIDDVIVTSKKSDYKWFYKEDLSKETLSTQNLNALPRSLSRNIINTMSEHIQF